MLIRAFTESDTDAVVQLWLDCGLVRPWNDPRKDIARKLLVQPELFLVGDLDGAVVASAMVGFDGHRGWLYYLAVAPPHQGGGFGRALVARAEQLLVDRGCPKLNIQVRGGNAGLINYYRALGFAEDGAVSLGKRLISDD